MKLQTIKNNNLNCFDYINLLITLGFITVNEAIEIEKIGAKNE